MDGDWITTMRTGAVAAHSINLLANSEFSNVAIAGLGNTAAASLLCLAESNSEKTLEIGLLKYKDQHLVFQNRFSTYPNLRFRVFDDISELAGWSEVFLSCITSTDIDLVDPEVFRPGSLVVPVHTRGFTLCDLSFDRVFCDDRSHVSGFKYFRQFESKLTEVASVTKGEFPGRRSPEERILVYNIGISLHDIFYASKIEERLSSPPACSINLEKPQTKFWV